MDELEAEKWASETLSTDEYEAEWGDKPEEPDFRRTLTLSKSFHLLQERAEATGQTASKIADEILYKALSAKMGGDNT